MEPGVEIMQPVQYPAARVDELKAAAFQLNRKVLHVCLDECRGRRALARDRQRLGGDVNACDECAKLA